MSLEELLAKNLIKPHQTDGSEIKDCLSIADRDIGQAEDKDIIPIWRLVMAHNAIVQCATAALNVLGYRARQKDYHKTVISSLEFTMGFEIEKVKRLQLFRRKRNIATYDKPEAISEMEADELLDLARLVRNQTETWLRQKYPGKYEGNSN